MTTTVLTAPAIRRRRTASAADPLKKVTVHLHESVSTAIMRMVRQGVAASQAAFIEDAVIAQLREIRRAKVYAAYAEAAADPTVMAEMAATTTAFDVTVADGRDA